MSKCSEHYKKQNNEVKTNAPQQLPTINRKKILIKYLIQIVTYLLTLPFLTLGLLLNTAEQLILIIKVILN